MVKYLQTMSDKIEKKDIKLIFQKKKKKIHKIKKNQILILIKKIFKT